MSTETITDARTDETVSADATSTGLDQNLAAALSYVFGLLTGLVFFFVEKDNEFVRFHAAQSMVFAVAVGIAGIVLSVLGPLLAVLFIGDAFITGGLLTGLLSLVLGLVSLVVGLGAFGLWVYLMVRAYQGKRTKLPVLGDFAERIAN